MCGSGCRGVTRKVFLSLLINYLAFPTCISNSSFSVMASTQNNKTGELLEAQAHIWNHIFSFINSMSLKSAIELGIPDIIHRHGKPMTLSELTNELPINDAKASCVYRLMRILTHSGFFTASNDNEECYLLTPASKLLLKDEPMCVSPYLQAMLDPILTTPWDKLSEWFQNDDPTTFATTHGAKFWDMASQNPRFNSFFNEAMASDARFVSRVLIENFPNVLEGISSLVDVGGGTGTMAKAIADAVPHLKCTVLDLPHVVNGLDDANIKNLDFVGGDMFQSIPPADAVLLKAMLDPILTTPWDKLSEWFQNDDPTTFATTHGAKFWDMASQNPRFNSFFNEAMASDARFVSRVLIENFPNVLEGISSLVDVGGGTGTMAKAIADAFPHLKCSVLDLPHVVNGLDDVNIKNLDFVGGDMFQSIPTADAVLLKWILHDWNDEECVQILNKCKEAIPSKVKGGKVMIIDMVLDNKNKVDAKVIETQLFFDMLMLVLEKGKERTEQEWGELFYKAGFIGYKITPMFGLRSLIEVFY